MRGILDWPNATKPWCRAEEAELRERLAAGESIREIARRFGRSEEGVRCRAQRLGLAKRRRVAPPVQLDPPGRQ